MKKQFPSANNLDEQPEIPNRYPEIGWYGLVPGVSKVEEAVGKLGAIEKEVEFANGKWFEFANHTVQVVVLNSDVDTIYKIRVLSDFPDKNLVPADIDQFEQIYGFIEQTDVDDLATVTYERPGLRVACQLLGNPQLVNWIEFYSADDH